MSQCPHAMLRKSYSNAASVRIVSGNVSHCDRLNSGGAASTAKVRSTCTGGIVREYRASYAGVLHWFY